MPILRYALIVILMTLIVSGIGLLLETYAQIRLGTVGGGAIPVFMTALIEGQLFCKRTGGMPDRGQTLRFAGMATAINLMLLGPALVLISLGDPAFRMMLQGFDAVLWSVILGAVVVITFPASYFFYRQGAASQHRAIARQKARQGGAK